MRYAPGSRTGGSVRMGTAMRRASVLATVLAGFLVLGVAPPAAVADTEAVLVKARFDPTIYEVQVDEWGDVVGERRAVTYAEWVAVGRPAPAVVEPDVYAALSWSSTIYAVTGWPGERWADAVPLSYAQWVSARRPAPDRSAPFCALVGCGITRYPSSSELFVDVPGSGGVHKLTFREWTTLGSPPVSIDQPVGFYRLSWSDRVFMTEPSQIGSRIGFTSDVYGSGRSLTYDAWRREGSPTPKVVRSAVRERFLLFAGSPDVYYDGPAGLFRITYAQWAAAGSPTPERKPFGAPSGGGIVVTPGGR